MFPFFMQNNCNIGNFYPSAMNYDLCSTNPWNSLNLHLNQAWDDMLARQSLYNVPLCNFSNISLYGNNVSTGIDNLLDPRYTLAQMKMANFNSSIFGNCGGSNFGNMDFSSLWMNSNPFANNGVNTSGHTGSSNTQKTPEDKAYEDNYDSLYALCKQLLAEKDGVLSPAKKNKLDEAMENTKGTQKEKFENLYKVYNTIDKNIVKEVIIKMNSNMGPDCTKGAGFEDSFLGRLTHAGYEYDASGVDDQIEELRTAIKGLKDNANQENASTILGTLGFSAEGGKATYGILDVLSSWNSKYSDEENVRNIIKFIEANYPEEEGDKATAKTKLLAPVVNALTSEARKYLDDLDAESKDKLKAAIKDVEKLLEQSDKGVASGLATAFDRLYVLTREAAIVVLQNDVIRNYGAIDKELFNDNLFLQDTLDDLDAELGGKHKNEMKVSENRQQVAQEIASELDARQEVETEGQEEGGDKTKPVAEQIQDLEGTAIETTNVKYTDDAGKEFEVVKEKNATGDRESARIFIKTDEGLKEVKNAEIKDGKLVAKEGAKLQISETITKAADIKKDYNRKVKAEKDAEAKAEADKKATQEKEEKLASMKAQAKIIAKDLYKRLDGHTGDGEWSSCIDIINDKVTTENVLYVIKEYNTLRGDDIFQQLQTEWHHGRADRSNALKDKILSYVNKNIDKLSDEKRTRAVELTEKLKTMTIDHKTEGKEIDDIVKELIELFEI